MSADEPLPPAPIPRPQTIKHRFFSPARVWALATNTLTELVRLKVFYFLLIFALLQIGSSLLFIRFTFQGQFQMLKDTSLGAMSIFTSMLAILATANLLPKDVEDRTLYTILAKPVPRFEYLTGKLLGVLLLLLISVALMGAMFAAVLWWRTHEVAGEIMSGGDSAEVMKQSLDELYATSYDPALWAGGLIIYAKAALLASLTLFVSTFASSSIFTIMVSVAVFFIGQLQGTARDYWQSTGTLTPNGFLDLAVFKPVVLIFPDLQAFNLVEEIVAGTPHCSLAGRKNRGVGSDVRAGLPVCRLLHVRQARNLGTMDAHIFTRRFAVFGRRYVVGVVLILAFGLARLPFERGLAQERLANSVNPVRLDLSLRERVSQNDFIAAMGGFRSLVADLLWIEAMTDWERVEYGKMNLKFGTVTTLAPHNVMFWDMAAWHMAYNASVAVMDDPKQPKLAIKKKRQREYFLLGKDYAERGIANNPAVVCAYHMLGEI